MQAQRPDVIARKAQKNQLKQREYHRGINTSRVGAIQGRALCQRVSAKKRSKKTAYSRESPYSEGRGKKALSEQ
jgi:hypothetical protein